MSPDQVWDVRLAIMRRCESKGVFCSKCETLVASLGVFVADVIAAVSRCRQQRFTGECDDEVRSRASAFANFREMSEWLECGINLRSI